MLAKLMLPALALATVAACTESGSSWDSLGRLENELAIIPRGSTCAQLGLGNQSTTLLHPVTGTYAVDPSNTLNLTYYDDTNTIFYFNNSTIKITGVLVSIGDRTLVWDIGVPGADAWPSLHGPINFDTGEIDSPEEVTFCYDYELYVQPSPFAKYENRNTWTITKTGRNDRLVLAQGQTEMVEYQVTVSHSDTTADGQFITGPFFLQNKSPHTVTVGTATVMVGEIAATVTCPSALPLTMAPFTVVECEFRADVPDTNDRNVVGSATVSHGLRVSTQEVVASFSSPTTSIDEVDDCIDVFDDAVPGDGYLGTVCAAQGEETYEFSYELGPITTCGNFAVGKTASYVGLDTGATAAATWTINGEVRCNPGCTLSQWYWKWHSFGGPMRFNTKWNQVGPQGGNTTFFRSGTTYLHAIWRLSFLNPYWTLTKAYIAAKLNQLNGAQFTSATATAFSNATSLLNSYTPAQVILNLSLRKQFATQAAVLRDWNGGRTGPGRCTCRPDLSDED